MKPVLRVNYHNRLEKILDKKDFTANTKSLLLSMLYKLEVAYNDYSTVKVFVKTKDEFLEDIINTIDKKCKVIKLVEPSSTEGSKMKKNNEEAVLENETNLVCFPTEKSLLVGITMIMNINFDVRSSYRMIGEVIKDFLNLSYMVNIQECFYNFDGWSWHNQFELEYQYLYTILYYNFLSITGLEFLEEWKNSKGNEDYVGRLIVILTKKYGKENTENLILLLYRLFLKILVKGYSSEIDEILEEGRKLKAAIDYMNNKFKYMQDIYDKKKEINARIKEIEAMMLDKMLLKHKYEELNKSLPLDKQIFSVKRFLIMIKQERETLYNEIKNYNLKLDPKVYMREKKALEQKYLKFSDLQKIQRSKTTLKTEVVRIQRKFLELKEMDVPRVENKKDILNDIYFLRYYKNMKFDNKSYLKEERLLKKSLKNYERKLIAKAIQNNFFITFSKNFIQNIEIISMILDTRIINLKDIEVMLRQEKNNFIIDVYDGEILDTSLKLNEKVKEMSLKVNKKTKLFI